MDKEFLTVRDVARLLGQSEDWVRDSLKTGRLPGAFKMHANARRWYIRAADFASVVENMKRKAEAEQGGQTGPVDNQL